VGILTAAELVMEAALVVRSGRAGILAANIANADTPGYVAHDVDFENALQRAIDTQGEDGQDSAALRGQAVVGAQDLRLDRNSMDASRELGAFHDNALAYTATLGLFSDSVARLKTAMNGGKG
jgi:flagellar basal-body rod protein FlgB